MPNRSFKVNIHNRSNAFTLNKQTDATCEGGYTDGWGAPPALINPNSDVSFQGESTSYGHGTEGYVIYGVFESNGDQQGLFAIHWSSPWLGNASVGQQVDDNHPLYFPTAIQNLSPDDSSGCGSFFNRDDGYLMSEPIQFSVMLGPYDGNWSGVPNDGDGHAEVDLTVQDQFSFGFTPSPASGTTYGQATNVTVDAWVGHWNSGGVDIQITKVSGDTVKIAITDAGSIPNLTMTEAVDVSKPSFLGPVRDAMESVIHQHLSSVASSATLDEVRTVVTQVLTRHAGQSAPALLKKQVLTSLANSKRIQQSGLPERAVVSLSNNLVRLLVQSRVFLTNDVVLTLMNAFDGQGHQIGRAIHYQRINLLGRVYRDVEVGPYQAPPR